MTNDEKTLGAAELSSFDIRHSVISLRPPFDEAVELGVDPGQAPDPQFEHAQHRGMVEFVLNRIQNQS